MDVFVKCFRNALEQTDARTKLLRKPAMISASIEIESATILLIELF